jgi:Lon-like ATP-dependent protease
MAAAIASAIKGEPVDNKLAMTGEVGIHGNVKPVGGVLAKVEAAFQAGAERVIVPRENWQAIFADLKGLEVIPADHIDEVFNVAFPETGARVAAAVPAAGTDVYIATGLPYLQADSVE